MPWTERLKRCGRQSDTVLPSPGNFGSTPLPRRGSVLRGAVLRVVLWWWCAVVVCRLLGVVLSGA